MALKADHFITPIRLVLPGIIVSVIGLFTSNYIFNNPEKIKGNSSRIAWDNLKRFEKIYKDYTEILPCEYKGNINKDYSQHLIHLQEMTAENLKMLRDDKDVDKLMAAIINLRIDTYTQLKNSSQSFFDSLSFYQADIGRLQELNANMQIKFINYNKHVYNRDSSIIDHLGQELSQHYKAFKNVNFNIFNNAADTLDHAILQNNIIGIWSLLTNDIPVLIKIDNQHSGTWTQEQNEHPFTWNLEKTKLTVHFTDKFEDNIVFDVIACTEKNHFTF